MSERKAEYYAKHLEQQNPNEQMELFQPVSLPTLLARMVTEFQVGLGSQTPETHEILVRTFTADLLSAAQPLLAEYLTAITTPPKWVNPDRDLGRYALYATRWDRKHDYPPMPYEEWCQLMRDMEQ